MKILFILSAFALVGSCATKKYAVKVQDLKDSIQIVDSSLVVKYSNTITTEELRNHLYTLTSDTFKGRFTGEMGQKMAANLIKTYYQNQQISSPFGNDNYFQIIPESFLPKDTKASENIVAFIKGEENPDEILIISAHYDHLGVTKGGEIYEGADDNASGTSAVLEIAQAFKLADNDGFRPKRSILFLNLTAEEIGKQGSEYYTLHPIFPLENTIADLNIDMIGRFDEIHKNNKDYLYLIGSDRLSNELHYLSEKVNTTFSKLTLDYRYNAENDSNRYYERSDHYNFAIHGIPVIFYFNGEHADYHKPTDTSDKIDFEILAKRTKFIFATAWQLANMNQRIKVDNGIIY
ncbi:MAG: M28 family peptidase [Flavobacteriales bacterium]|nr:M28 family peptidase [Flavobacteriia bacterium]NCP05898.1 M28 family peptidase [Flavobacteriales bacterium]PIV94896.1 MAG: peptidase M28 [Flavobacteriaceae bacterium CG17_big_fil_post_rev_8_21_14_2_50_33_15]PIY09952.1 MAG: peptidase M28 [Flavobacteriaceae bacterium CG_4_10_14_3_um_filter_33_47]PJB19556.1 MAG: peptidase M28 [Flavobacteriaceae bacterium CG_4_9_14_3_um_filter_33_16]